jgi:hypothetical protein
VRVGPPIYLRLPHRATSCPDDEAVRFGFEHQSSCPGNRTRLARAAVALGIAAPMATLAPPSGSHSAAGTPTRCVRISAKVARYCGPASARLSVFPDARFRSGFCARERVAGVALLQVRIGARSLDGSSTNDRLPYFSLGAADSRSRPTSGNVVAFYQSRRWVGRVVSMKTETDGGRFVAQGLAGNQGRATGRFRC